MKRVFLQPSNDKECTVLREYIEAIAFNSGNSLRDQQLTNEGIPVIVDKCIRFVYSHGCLTEGEISVFEMLPFIQTGCFQMKFMRANEKVQTVDVLINDIQTNIVLK